MFWVAEEQNPAPAEDIAGTESEKIESSNGMQPKAAPSDSNGKRFEQRHPAISRWAILKWPLLSVYHLWRAVAPQDDLSNSQAKLPTSASTASQGVPTKHWATFGMKPTRGTDEKLSSTHRKNKVVPLACKIRERHLELEPLCCLSSCLVRGGCTAVVAFEYTYAAFTVFAVILRMHSSGHFSFWSAPFNMSYDIVVTHSVPLYILLVYDLVAVAMATALLRALCYFDKKIVRLHLYFNYFALGFNVIASVAFFPALILQHSEARTFANILLTLCFVSHIPVQIWAISVVRSCLEFFVLVHVFVQMAEK